MSHCWWMWWSGTLVTALHWSHGHTWHCCVPGPRSRPGQHKHVTHDHYYTATAGQLRQLCVTNISVLMSSNNQHWPIMLDLPPCTWFQRINYHIMKLDIQFTGILINLPTYIYWLLIMDHGPHLLNIFIVQNVILNSC